MYVSELLTENEGASELSSRLAGIAGKTAKSFVDTFLNEYGYVDGDMLDWSVLLI